MTLLRLPATAGTQADLVVRLKAVLPTGWFGEQTPILDGVLNGLAAAWSGLFGLLALVQQQSRIATASDVFLDLIATDFFGDAMKRPAGFGDTVYRRRILRGLLRERGTRGAIIGAITDLTGTAPAVFEPARTTDTGGYGSYAGAGGGLGYNRAGGWGSLALPFQCFVVVRRPVGNGVANCCGFGGPLGGYGVGALQYTTRDMAQSQVLDADLFAAVAGVLPVAVRAWTAIVAN